MIIGYLGDIRPSFSHDNSFPLEKPISSSGMTIRQSTTHPGKELLFNYVFEKEWDNMGSEPGELVFPNSSLRDGNFPPGTKQWPPERIGVYSSQAVCECRLQLCVCGCVCSVSVNLCVLVHVRFCVWVCLYVWIYVCTSIRNYVCFCTCI